MVSVRLTENQEKRIKETGQTKSEFIRRAVDYYFEYLNNPYNDKLLNELQEFINSRRVTHINTPVTIDNTPVTTNNTPVTTNNTPVTTSNTGVTHNNTPVTICNTNPGTPTTKQPKNTDHTPQKTIKQKLIKELELINRLLNNPENMETIPDVTLKTLSKRHSLSKATILEWINENKAALKAAEYEKI